MLIMHSVNNVMQFMHSKLKNVANATEYRIQQIYIYTQHLYI